jgi:hypothetical protein
MTWLEAASARVVARWTRLYTAGLPAPVRDRRREEIGADVHGQLDDARSRRERPAVTAAAMMSRLARGAVHDLSWRHEVGRPASLARWQARRAWGLHPGFVLAAQSLQGISGQQRSLTRSIACLWLAALAISLLITRLLPARTARPRPARQHHP